MVVDVFGGGTLYKFTFCHLLFFAVIFYRVKKINAQIHFKRTVFFVKIFCSSLTCCFTVFLRIFNIFAIQFLAPLNSLIINNILI